MNMRQRRILWSSFFVWSYSDEQKQYKMKLAEELLILKQVFNESIADLLTLPLNIRPELLKVRERMFEEERKRMEK